MASQGGFGANFKVAVSSVLTTVPGARDVVFPTQEKIIAEDTGHDAASGYATWVGTGKRRLGAFTVKINFDADNAVHAVILGNIASDDTINMSIQDPDGDEIIAFAGHIKMLGRVSPQEDGFTGDVQVQPSGPPTIT